MPKFNQYLIENKKSIELVQELKDYEIKRSPLSKVARGKVISKSSSGYVSENKEGYGPGNSQSDDYSSYPTNDREWRNWASSGGRSTSSPGMFQSSSESIGFVVETYLKASVAMAITVATGGLAPIVGGSMWIGGELLESTNVDFLKFVGSNVKSIGSGTFFGGVFANSTIGEVAKNSGISFETLEWFYEAKGTTETVRAVGKHGEHRSRGLSYDSGCEVCNR